MLTCFCLYRLVIHVVADIYISDVFAINADLHIQCNKNIKIK